MALLIIDGLEAVEVDGNHRKWPRPLARKAIEFFCIKRAVAKLGQHIVLAQVLQIGLSLLASRDVYQREQHQAPVVLMTTQHRKLHVDVHRIPRQRVIGDLTLLHGLAFPQILQLLSERLRHFTPKHLTQVVEQVVFGPGSEHLQRLLVHVDHTDLLHAPRNEFWVYFEKGFEISDSLRTHAIEQHLDGAEVLNPQRHGGVFKQAAGILLATSQLESILHLPRDVFQ